MSKTREKDTKERYERDREILRDERTMTEGEIREEEKERRKRDGGEISQRDERDGNEARVRERAAHAARERTAGRVTCGISLATKCGVVRDVQSLRPGGGRRRGPVAFRRRAPWRRDGRRSSRSSSSPGDEPDPYDPQER